jgi:hypothetical protein
LPADAVERAVDRGGYVVRDRDQVENLADLRAACADSIPVSGLETRELIQAMVDRRRAGDDSAKRVRRDAKTGRYADAVDP